MKSHAIVPLAVVAVVVAASAPLLAENWPSWRGPGGMGISVDAAAPIRWTKTEHVRWRVELPEPGNSTPVVWGDRVFVTQALAKQNRRTVMCFDRATGKLLWQSGVTYAQPDITHPTNPLASPSPVTDGQLVYAWFGSGGLAAYDFTGRQVWLRDLGPQKHTWGYASSPVLSGDRLILNFGPGARAFVIALDKKTGTTAWQFDIPPSVGIPAAGWTAEDMYGSWGTPLVVRTDGRDELIVSGPRRVYALDPVKGTIIWTSEGLSDLVYSSPVSAAGVVVAMGGFGGASLAARLGGSGDVTNSHRLWQTPRSRQMIGSGVIKDGYVYVVDAGGIAECMDVKTGKVVWTQRLRSSGDEGVWSSLVLNQDRIYVMNKSADVFIFKAAPRFELLATNALGEDTNSSVVISDGDIFLRTHAALWSIGETRR